MTDHLKQFGVDRDSLPVDVKPEFRYPEVVAGRVAHIDADFMAYQAAADRRDELDGTKPRKTVPEKCERARMGLDHLRRCAGAETYVAHITPSGSDKGGRDRYAVTLPYQGNREDRDRPEHLDQIRAYISTLPARIHLDQEADDGMAQANYKAISGGVGHLSVIVSKDKDLRMVPGLHWDFDTETVITAPKFGHIWIDDSKSSKTLKGWGTKFFWAQLLMGDTADNIKGLPAVTKGAMADLDRIDTELQKLYRQHDNAKDKHREEAVFEMIRVSRRRQRKIGAMLAYDILAPRKTDKDCFELVRALFKDLDVNSDYTFIDHKTQEPCTGTQALFGDMLTLWMRRKPDPMDVLHWNKEEKVL